MPASTMVRFIGVRRRYVFGVLCLVFLALAIFFWKDFCLWRAEGNLAARQHGAAAAWLQRGQWFDSRIDRRTCLLKLRLARRNGDFAEVERLLAEATKLGVPRKELDRERWLAMAQTNQFEQMDSHWTDLLKDARDDEPEIARAHYTWAMIYHNHDVAKWTLEVWRQDYPQDLEPVLLAGRYCQAVVDWAGAEKAYRDGLAIAPDNEECQLALAKVLQIRLKTDEATLLFQKYLRRHPEDLTAIRGLAETYATAGKIEEAISLLQEALKKHPDDFGLMKSCGELLLSNGDVETAAGILEQAHRMIPEHANLANSLARAWKACGRFADAEPLFAFVAESQPRLLDMANMEKELRDHPQNLELRMKIAEIVAKYVSRRDAIRWYENVLVVAPHFKPALQELARLYRSLGDEAIARRFDEGAEKGAR